MWLNVKKYPFSAIMSCSPRVSACNRFLATSMLSTEDLSTCKGFALSVLFILYSLCNHGQDKSVKIMVIKVVSFRQIYNCFHFLLIQNRTGNLSCQNGWWYSIYLLTQLQKNCSCWLGSRLSQSTNAVIKSSENFRSGDFVRFLVNFDDEINSLRKIVSKTWSLLLKENIYAFFSLAYTWLALRGGLGAQKNLSRRAFWLRNSFPVSGRFRSRYFVSSGNFS